jgi:hypothetical protein
VVASNYGCQINTKKHNINTEDVPKMDIIGDYWDKEIITQVVNLIKKYEDLFPYSFSKIKGIAEYLRAMKI